jgi:LysR family nitrogen assimilation transcriptional regulator
MDLKQLNYFVHVAELGSFTQAEHQLGVPQPTLSKQIRALERELEHALFERTGRGVVLTEAGRRFHAHAQALLTQVERTRREMIDGSEILTGECVVGFPPGVGRAITVGLVWECQERLPEVRLVLSELRSKDVVEQIGEGRLDLGLAHHPRPATRHEAKHLLSERLYLVSSADSAGAEDPRPQPVTVAELERYGFVVHGDRQTRRSLILSEIANAKIDLNVVAEVGSSDAVLDLVQAGMGHAVLPASALRYRPDRFTLRPIVDPPLETTLSLVTPSRRPITRLTTRVAEIIETVVAENMGAGTTVRAFT